MPEIVTTILSFVFALGVIVFVHELGHHLVAKLFGVRVVTFSLGFGNRLWGIVHNGTDYRISTIPLGGYVRMGGDLHEERTGDPSELLSKPRWQRILIYLAGPAMNVVLSIALIAGVFMYGVEMQADQEIPAVVGAVEEGSPAAAAGLRSGDKILKIEGREVELWKDVTLTIAMSPERPLTLEVEREGQVRTTELTPVKQPPQDVGDAGMWSTSRVRIVEVIAGTPSAEAGFRAGDEIRFVDGRAVHSRMDFIQLVSARPGQTTEFEVLREGETVALTAAPADEDGQGKIGVLISGYQRFRRLAFGEAIVESVKFNVDIVVTSAVILKKLVTRELSPKSTLSGPIEIAAMSGRAARLGLRYLIYTMGFLSISIGFMNLLPIPVLDGGHISILLIESVLRRDLSLVLKERITQVGFMMLVTLMAVVIFFDLAKNLPDFFSGG